MSPFYRLFGSNRGDRHEARHSVVECNFLLVVSFDDFGNEKSNDPVALPLFRHFLNFFNAHFSYGGSSVVQVLHENWLQEFEECLFSELDAHITD